MKSKRVLGVGALRVPEQWMIIRKYPLTVLFGLAALLFILTAALVISYTVGRIAENNLTRIAKESITSDAVEMLSMIRQPSQPLTLESLAAPGGLPRQLPVLVENYGLVKLNLIDPQGVLVWSTDRRAAIGTGLDVSPTSVQALSGNTASRFLPSEEVANLDGVRPRLAMVQVSLPLREPGSSKVIGVLEVYRNVNDDVPFLIGATRSSVVRVTAATMGGLFIVLVTIVVVADVTISRSKRREKLTLENQLTERQQAASALLESNLRLEEVVDELKKTQEQIVQQERLRALGEMASGIAHDFNNTLTPILGYSSLLVNQPEKLNDPEALKKQLTIINTAAEDAAAVVARLREFYRGRTEQELSETLSLNELATQAVSLTQAKWKDQAQARGVTIKVETELSDVPSVLGNASQIREALMNLVLNAVDAMPEGGSITLKTYADGGHVVLKVTDTGTGMPEEVRQRCLDPFFTTKGSHGTGMGLAMVYGIVQRHQGKMDIQTAVGQGTSFLLHFPVPAQSPSSVDDSDGTQVQINSLKVLVVDDEPMILQLISEYLTSDGHSVVTATDGKEGIAKFGSATFDLVLTDRAMPEMSGDQLAAAIKEQSPATPVILVTGFGGLMSATSEKPPAVDLVLSKPVEIDQLRRAMAQVIGCQEAHSPESDNQVSPSQDSSLALAAV